MTLLESLFASTFAFKAGSLDDEVQLRDVPKWNSLSHMELIIGIEQTYGVDLSQDDIVEMTSVGAIRRVLRRLGVVNP